MVRTLVVGSTGEIGLPLTLALIKEGHKVFALVRSSSKLAKADMLSQLEEAGVSLVDGDISNPELVTRVFEQLHPVEAVVCAVSGQPCRCRWCLCPLYGVHFMLYWHRRAAPEAAAASHCSQRKMWHSQTIHAIGVQL